MEIGVALTGQEVKPVSTTQISLHQVVMHFRSTVRVNLASCMISAITLADRRILAMREREQAVFAACDSIPARIARHLRRVI
jgi:tmRNA-binding protein